MEEAGLVVVGFVLQLLLCRLDGLKPVDCKPLHPQRHTTRHECEVQAEHIKAGFPNMEPEQFGLSRPSGAFFYGNF
jgi:hypothetical protein